MIVDIILWVFFGIWVLSWAATFYQIGTMNQYQFARWEASGRKFKYGVLDVIGILALAGIFARNW